ncbi:MAG: hypothetical protein FWE89_03850 [Syntrophaceae bacterium]|nr:hypothetical protein [Syntrophaceae bacterium]
MSTYFPTGLDNAASTKASSTASTSSSSTSTLGKDEFLKLLVAQLKNQDPLNPTDSTTFTSQLAEFSSLEQLTNLNTELKNQSLNQMTLGYAQSASMIGKEVLVEWSDGPRTGIVTAVHYQGNEIWATIDDQIKVPLSAISEVRQPEAPQAPEAPKEPEDAEQTAQAGQTGQPGQPEEPEQPEQPEQPEKA